MLVVPGTELTGENITYTIYRTVPWWFDEKEAQFSNAGFTTWVANESGEDYYFEAEITKPVNFVLYAFDSIEVIENYQKNKTLILNHLK